MQLKYCTAEVAVKEIKSGDRVFVHGSAATPLHLLKALFERRSQLNQVELICITTLGEGIFDVPDFGKSFFINSLFVSENAREIVNSKDGGYIPVFLSEIPLLFKRGILPVDVALIHVSPPDKHGFCSLGTSVDVAVSAIQNARFVIAQVNPRMPRSHGDGIIHTREINTFVDINQALPEIGYDNKSNAESIKIAQFCAELIEDRSTLQMGIGSIPNAVLSCLHNHKDLGIHTEMFSDGILPLIEKGIISNKFKKKHCGKIITSFAVGSRNLYDFIDDNPEVNFLTIDYVNDPRIISANPRTVAINSALEIDLTGQICADSIGTYQYSGVGGQIDFMRGATLSENGIPIIAMNSTTKNGASKIVPFLKNGAGVVSTRAHVHYVVTEFGVVNLFGKNLKQRAVALTGIAHPIHREKLEEHIFERFGRVV